MFGGLCVGVVGSVCVCVCVCVFGCLRLGLVVCVCAWWGREGLGFGVFVFGCVCVWGDLIP